MADHAFERRLQQMFAEAPAYPDASAFAGRVEQRLDRGWAVRRVAIGAAGLAGGGIAVAQVASTGWLGRLELASRSAAADAGRNAGGVLDTLGDLAPALRAIPLGAETLWLIAGLAALAIALLATRALEQL